MLSLAKTVVPLALKSFFPILEVDDIDIEATNSTDTRFVIGKLEFQPELVRNELRKLNIPLEPVVSNGKAEMTVGKASITLDASRLTSIATGWSGGDSQSKLPVDV